LARDQKVSAATKCRSAGGPEEDGVTIREELWFTDRAVLGWLWVIIELVVETL
jgi:hypothetical protein